jgi:hypothetical protein
VLRCDDACVNGHAGCGIEVPVESSQGTGPTRIYQELRPTDKNRELLIEMASTRQTYPTAHQSLGEEAARSPSSLWSGCCFHLVGNSVSDFLPACDSLSHAMRAACSRALDGDPLVAKAGPAGKCC